MSATPLLPSPALAARTTGAAEDRGLGGLCADTGRTMIGFLIYGGLASLVGAVCLASAAIFRNRVRREIRCQRIIHWGVRRWEAVMEALGVFRVDFPEAARLSTMRGTIFAPNHTSLIDAPHFLARLPRLVCVMKRSILSNPFMGSSSLLAGYLPMDQPGRDFVRRGRDALLEGNNLLIFPEGTRTIDPPVNPFKKGFALMATLTAAPVQTVFIEMPILYLGKRWPLWRIPRMPVPIKIRLGRRFEPQPGQSAKAFGAELEEYFRLELGPTAGRGVKRK